MWKYIKQLCLFSTPADKFAHLKLGYKCCACTSEKSKTTLFFCLLQPGGWFLTHFCSLNGFDFQNAVMFKQS